MRMMALLMVGIGIGSFAQADVSCSMTAGGDAFLNVSTGVLPVVNLTVPIGGGHTHTLQWKLDSSWWSHCSADDGTCATRVFETFDFPKFSLEVTWDSSQTSVKNAQSWLSYDDQDCLNCSDPTQSEVFCTGSL